jgi:molybdopterin converting factor small subunit
MTDISPPTDSSGVGDHTASAGPTVRVRYWAAARAAAGVESETVVGETLADVLAAVNTNHPNQRFADVLEMCAVLVGDQPVGARDPADIRMADGTSVEFLPPFAGG